MDIMSDRDDVRVVILTAAGKLFSAGADVERARRSREGSGRLSAAQPADARIFLRGRGLRGAGDRRRQRPGDQRAGYRAEAVLRRHAGDRELLLVMPSSTWASPAARASSWSTWGSPPRGRCTSPAAACRPTELYRLGVIEQPLRREQLMPAAMEIARQIAAKSPSPCAR